MQAPDNTAANTGRFPVPFSLEEFRDDLVWLCFAYIDATTAFASQAAALALSGLPPDEIDAVSRRAFESPADMNLTYQRVASWHLVRSLVSMYRFGFLGQKDTSVEELGPGGYHIAVAALVRDMERSSYQRFTQRIDASKAAPSIARCLHVVELANARLTLEGLPRFFNFDVKDDSPDFEALVDQVDGEYPQGGYGAALTVRQMALLSGLEEQSIRTFSNPARPNSIATEQRKGRIVVRIEDAKSWLVARNRYVPLSESVDDTGAELARRAFVSLQELENVVMARLGQRHAEALPGQTSLQVLRELAAQHGTTPGDDASARRAWMTLPGCVREVADLIHVPADLFALRVSEVVFTDALQSVRRNIDMLSKVPA